MFAETGVDFMSHKCFLLTIWPDKWFAVNLVFRGNSQFKSVPWRFFEENVLKKLSITMTEKIEYVMVDLKTVFGNVSLVILE